MPAYLVRGRFEGMKILWVYIDTSVISGRYFNVEFAPWSNSLMQDFRGGISALCSPRWSLGKSAPHRNLSASNTPSFSGWEQSFWPDVSDEALDLAAVL